MKPKPSVEDLIGIESTKLGFFRQLQDKIDELRASNAELETKQRHIQAILDGITDAMAVLDEELRFISVNHVFYKFFGPFDPTGKRCCDVFRQESQPCSACPVKTARENNEVCRQLWIIPNAGSNRHYEMTASPLRDHEGKPRHFLLLLRDVTVEKELQAKYYQSQNMASLGVLAAGVAHEINNPLTAVYGFAEGLKRRLPRVKKITDEDIFNDFAEYVGIIQKECGRCLEIVQNLLTFGRQRSLTFSSVSLNCLVLDTLKLLKYHLKQYPANIVALDLNDDLPLVKGDASQLKQVILNLLSNALDAVGDGGSIKIRTYLVDGNFIGLAVEDTGCGIAPENLSKLFEPFFTTKPIGKGIGIGLSTCYNIAREHGGEIVVNSRLGQGSTFLVKLPKEV